MANRIALEKEIKDYCNINNIIDVPGFITQCMLQGFNIYKYGISPQDNKKRENNEVEVKISNREKKPKKEKEVKKPEIRPQVEDKISKKEEVKQETIEEKPIKITKRKIKVISND